MTVPSAAAVAMIERLVAFPTVSRDSNLPLIDWIRDYLGGFGIAAHLTHDDTGHKANLFATIGPAGVGGVMLSGHTDVVPVDGQAWTVEPFRALVREGRIYGRGTSDMKSFVAVVLAKVPAMVAAAHRLREPIHLAFSYDEEIGCIGVQRLIASLGKAVVRPRLCIVGEPTMMRVINGHKGKGSWRGHAHGLECHSSAVENGVNAIEAAAEVVTRLKSMGRRFRAEGPFDDGFDPPYTSVHTGTITGGLQLNIVPKDCVFEFEFRCIPGLDPTALFETVRAEVEADIVPEMRRVHAPAGFTWEPMSLIPGLAPEPDNPAEKLCLALTGLNAPGKAAYATEAGRFQAAGIPTVVCGPGHVDQAHKPDEFIALDQVAQCEKFLDRLIARLAAD